MQTPVEIFRVIEEQMETYAHRRLKELMGTSEMSDSELHTARGKAIATQDLLRALRNSLGYNPDSL